MYKTNKLKELFSENSKHQIETRQQEKFKIDHANTNRMRNSNTIYMQHLLNEEHNEKRKQESHEKKS